MKKKLPKLERLAREIESMNNPNLTSIVAHIRDDKYDRVKLAEELTEARCRFFAMRLMENYYDDNPL